MILVIVCNWYIYPFAIIGDFQRAVEFCEASCRAVETVHGSHAIELTIELHKLIQLLFNR